MFSLSSMFSFVMYPGEDIRNTEKERKNTINTMWNRVTARVVLPWSSVNMPYQRERNKEIK
jgi:hypothetical protein